MPSLLDRQRAIIDHLRTPTAFRGEGIAAAPDVVLQTPDRLRRVGENALRKRATSARAAFPRTVSLLGNDFIKVFSDFADAEPCTGLNRWENALQFHDYLHERWRGQTPQPAYLSDVLAFEAALWRAWRRPKRQRVPDANADQNDIVGRFACAEDVILLALAHDVRPLVEQASSAGPIVERQVHLIFRRVRGSSPAKIFEVPEMTFMLLNKMKVTSAAAERLLVEPGLDRTMLRTLISFGILESAL